MLAYFAVVWPAAAVIGMLFAAVKVIDLLGLFDAAEENLDDLHHW